MRWTNNLRVAILLMLELEKIVFYHLEHAIKYTFLCVSVSVYTCVRNEYMRLHISLNQMRQFKLEAGIC